MCKVATIAAEQPAAKVPGLVPNVPEWVSSDLENLLHPPYHLTAENNGGEQVEVVELTSQEYRELKRYLALMRGLISQEDIPPAELRGHVAPRPVLTEDQLDEFRAAWRGVGQILKLVEAQCSYEAEIRDTDPATVPLARKEWKALEQARGLLNAIFDGSAGRPEDAA